MRTRHTRSINQSTNQSKQCFSRDALFYIGLIITSYACALWNVLLSLARVDSLKPTGGLLRRRDTKPLGCPDDRDREVPFDVDIKYHHHAPTMNRLWDHGPFFHTVGSRAMMKRCRRQAGCGDS